MTTRALFGTLFVILAIALGVCALFARFSRKAHNQSAALLLFSLIPPVVGNMIITFTVEDFESRLSDSSLLTSPFPGARHDP